MTDENRAPAGPQPGGLCPIQCRQLDIGSGVDIAMHLGVAAHQVTPGKAAIGQSLGGHDKPRLHRSIVKAPEEP